VHERDRHRTAFGEITLRAAAGRHTFVGGAAVEHEAYRPRDLPQFAYSFLVPGAFVQADVDLALLAAPANLRNQATVVKWKPDLTYDTLRKGTNRLVCYDRSGQPGQQPFSIECTSLGNMDRVTQNLRFEAMGDKRQAMLDAAEKDGTRVKPEYGRFSTTWRAPSRHARTRT